mmetsp:Transcript_77085/g.249476  ORF Transcript_77085/g.249476 Transcript_77085/m.249476 type:complete len:81 (+) Transcript_77085:1533-1775(+)
MQHTWTCAACIATVSTAPAAGKSSLCTPVLLSEQLMCRAVQAETSLPDSVSRAARAFVLVQHRDRTVRLKPSRSMHLARI